MNRMEEAIDKLTDEELDLLNSDPEMLAAFKAKYSATEGLSLSTPELISDLTPSTENVNVTDQGNRVISPISKLGDVIRGGYAGTGSLMGGNDLPTAAGEVRNVMAGLEPETKSGRAGEFAGSFFTPAQIALQATGAKAAPYISKGLGMVAKPITKMAVNAFPKISELLGAAPEAITRLAENPKAVKAAKSLPQMADEVANTVKGFGQKGMTTAAEGKLLLSAEKAVPGLKKSLNDLAMKIEGGPLAEEADKLAGKYVRELAGKLKEGISEKEVGKLIDTLDDKIGAKWAKVNPTVMTEAKEEVRRVLSRALQSQNKKYASAMAESASSFGPTETLTKNLGLKSGAPSDTTIPALKKITNPDALSTQRALMNFPGLSEEVANAAAKAALQESLLGKSAMFLTPYLDPLVQGSVRAAPAAANAIYEGLR